MWNHQAGSQFMGLVKALIHLWDVYADIERGSKPPRIAMVRVNVTCSCSGTPEVKAMKMRWKRLSLSKGADDNAPPDAV